MRARIDRVVQSAASPALLVILLFAGRSHAKVSPCEKAKAQLEVLSSQVALFRAARGAYPPADRWIDALKGEGLMLKDEPVRDPWGHLYGYRRLDDDFDLFTVGPDGVERTADDQTRAGNFRWKACRGPSGC